MEKCADYAACHGIKVISIYADEAVSGMKSNREQLNLLFDAAEKKEFECVLIYDQSRFSRDIIDWFMFRMREKVKDAMDRMAKQALYTGGKPLLGYDVQDSKYVINEYEAEIVRLIFSLYAQGKSYKMIINTLNSNGYKTKRDLPFGTNSLSSLLRNERYIGIYVYKKIPPAVNCKRNSHAVNPEMIKVEGGVPQIVPLDIWKAVQTRLKNNTGKAKNKAKINYYLAGKLFCGLCGKAMIGMRSNYTHYFYTCSGKQRLKNCCKENIKKDLLESLVANSVKKALFTYDQREEIAKEIYEQQIKIQDQISPAVNAIKAKIASVNNRIRNINMAIADGVWNSSTSQMLSNLEQQEMNLQLQLSKTGRTKVMVQNSFDDIMQVLEHLSTVDFIADSDSKEALLTFIDKVIVYDDHFDIILNLLKKEVPADIVLSTGTFINGAADRI